MESMRQLFSGMKALYYDMNPATLSGAIDIVVVEQPDGSLRCSPFHVRFGKLFVFSPREKVVHIKLNGEPLDLKMKVGEAGECFFVVPSTREDPEYMCTSPIPGTEVSVTHSAEGAKEEQDKADPATTKMVESVRQDLHHTGHVGDAEVVQQQSVEAATDAAAAASVQVTAPAAPATPTVSKAVSGQGSQTLSVPPLVRGQSDSLLELEHGARHQADGVVNGHQHDLGKARVAASVPPTDSEPASPLSEGLHAEATNRKSLHDWGWGEIPHASDSDQPASPRKLQQSSRQDDAAKTPVNENEGDELPAMDRQTQEFVLGVRFDSPSSGSDTDSEADHPERRSSSRRHHRTPRNSHAAGSHAAAESSRSNVAPHAHPAKAPTPTNNSACDASPEASPDGSPRQPSPARLRSTRGLHAFRPPSTAVADRLDTQVTGEPAAVLNGPVLGPPTDAAGDGAAAADTASTSAAGATTAPASTAEAAEAAEMGSASAPALTPTHQLFGALGEVQLSLCGSLERGLSREALAPKFEKYRVTHEQLCKDPQLLTSPHLVLCIQGKYYNWAVAGPVLLSYAAFGKPLDSASLEKLYNDHMPDKASRGWPARLFGRWRSIRSEEQATQNAQADQSTKDSIRKVDASAPAPTAAAATSTPGAAPAKLVRTKSEPESGKSESEVTDSETDYESEHLRKSLFLSSQQLAELNLREGPNSIQFTVYTKMQGKATVSCSIHRMKWYDRIVVSDIDGTITKSDVLGHAAALIGRDWTQVGVASLFSAIEKNGYKFVYLSSRSISHAGPTRGYLKAVRQMDTHTLPEGPILLSPSSLLASIHREVIARRPEVFKIACLKDLKRLFPKGSNPLVAGFGNRPTDELAYREVGIAANRIYLVDPAGLVQIPTLIKTTYNNIRDTVDHYFPSTSSNAHTYNNFAYWRPPLPEVDDAELV
eukprot:m.73667 g.73667  ORF g.73667 m.73667 type:complete len:937 (+) comp17049_c0_seq1:285-3095(+)